MTVEYSATKDSFVETTGFQHEDVSDFMYPHEDHLVSSIVTRSSERDEISKQK